MPSKRAGSITINLSLGTAQFVRDMENARAKVFDFGRAGGAAMREFGEHGVSQVQAISGELRVFEGGMNGSLRAAERFLASIKGIGPVAQALFPIAGGIAFVDILVKMGQEAYKFVETMRNVPEKMAGNFAGLNAGLRTTNDALELANARLDQDIAKLEGKRQNTLAVALLEAKKAADDLADSLDRDLASLTKVLDENKATVWQQIFGRTSDAGLREKIGGATGFGGVRGDIREETDRGYAAIDAAAAVDAKSGNTKGVDAAIADLRQKLQKRYRDLLAYLDSEIAKQQKIVSAGDTDFGSGEGSAAARLGANAAAKAASDFAAELQYVRHAFMEESRNVNDQVGHYQRTERKTGLQGDAEKAKLDRPFEDRMKALGAELTGIQARMEAIGQGAGAQAIAKAFGDAQKAIEEINKRLEENKGHLTKAQEGSLRAMELTLAQSEAEATWKTRLNETNVSLDQRIAEQRALTDAIGKGYEATKQAKRRSWHGAIPRS